jgi:hypothetical protein
MINKILKQFKIIHIDVIIYFLDSNNISEDKNIDYKIENEFINQNKKRFFVTIDGKLAHESYLFKKIFLLKLINKKGPAIGECFTNEEFKGKSIYPFVINHIAREEILKNKQKEVFIIVNSDNVSSIRGIVKAGFTIHTKIKANRFLFFHYNVFKSDSYTS